MFIIQGPEDDCGYTYWSNEDGWGDKDSATRFTKKEIESISMPIGFTNIEKV